MLKLCELPASEHPGYRLNQLGPTALATSELFDLILGHRQGDDLLDAIEKVGGLARLPSLTEVEMMQLPGVGKATAARLKATVELGRRMAWATGNSRVQITSPADIANLGMAEMSSLDKEQLRVAVLDTRNFVIAFPIVYIGNVSTCVIRISEVMREAITRNAPSIVLVHNHPSGDTSPSPEDVRITRQVVEAGNLLSIEVMDHIIIAGNSYTSLKERGLGFN